MNTKTQEALKMAMGFAGVISETYATGEEAEKVINACKEALEQPAQEPVAIVYSMQDGYIGQMVVKDIPHKTKLYTHPAPSWQGLSDDEKLAIIRKWKDARTMREQELIGLGDAFEKALKEKNNV